MADPLDPARYVAEAAALVGLTMAPGDLGEATQAFAVLARAAAAELGAVASPSPSTAEVPAR